MRYYLLLLVFFGIVLSGCSQTVVKYQCADGSFVDSVDLCSAMTCPKVNCPSLDCNACPVKVETKFETTFETITEYQCWDGSVEDDLNSCPKTEIDNQEDCPDFSSLSDRVSCENEESCSFAILNDGGMGKVGEFKLYPWDATPGQFYPYSVAYATCRKGREKGENANYFYCSGMYTIIKKVDASGNILDSKEPSIKLVIYNSKIIDTVCG